MEDREGKDLLVEEALGLIDVSFANDSFVRTAAMSSSTVTDDALNFNGHQFSGTQSEALSFEFTGAPHTDKALEIAQASEQSEQLPQLLETSEPERETKSGKCNLRKSLAWDSAFFTSAGVLDADELSTMIKGGDKGVKHLLPGIEEDVHTSMDSISTLESDNLTLESLEAELFEDIRASIQKSSRASNKANLSCKVAPGGMGPQTKASTSLKKIDLAAGSKLTPKSGGKMQTNAIQSGKMIKQSSGSPQVTQSVMKIRESTSSIPRPTKSISKVNPMPSTTSKRASLSANHVKVENSNAPHTSINHKGTQASKVTSLGDPRRGVPKSSISSRPSSLGSSTTSKTESMRSSSSCGSSGSSSENIGKSPVNSARRNHSKPVNSSGPIRKTTSTIAPRRKTSALTSGLSAHMISSKLSSNISPASSISEWSTESSSSTSTVNQRSTSRPSLDTSSCRSSNGDLDLNIHFTDKMPDRNRNHKAELPNQIIKKAAAQTGSLSRPDSMKPSGLRMPSPKIGFFDGSKSVRTPNGGMQSQARLSTGFPKDGAGLSSPIGSSNKAKLGKLPPMQVVKASTSLKPATRGSASPKLSQGLPSPSAKVSIASKDAKICFVKSPKVQTETGEISCLKTEHERESGKLEISDNKLSISMKEIAELKEIVIPLLEGGITDSSLNTYLGNLKSHGVGEDAIYGQDDLKKMTSGETNDKETDNFGVQVDDLARDFGTMDLQLAMQKKISDITKSCFELSSSNPCPPELCSKQNFNDIQKEEPMADVKEIVIPLTEGGITDSILDSCVGDIKPHGVGTDVIHVQGEQKNELLGETNEKETDHFGDQFDDLARDFVFMDLQLAMPKEIAGSSKSRCELSSNPCAPELCSKQNFIDVQNQKEETTAEIVIPLPEGGITDSSLHTCVDDIKPHGVVEDAVHGQDDLKNKTPGQTNERETDPFGDQFDDLARNIVAMDLKLALQKEIAGSTNSFCELTCSNPCAPEVCSRKTFIEVHMEEPTANACELSCSNPRSLELYSEKNFIEVQMEEPTAKSCDHSCSNPCAPESCSDKNFIEVQMEKPTANSCELSCSNPSAPELCSEKNFIEVQLEDSTATSRTPLTEKNSFCNSEGLDALTGSGIELVEKTVELPSLEIAQKENI